MLAQDKNDKERAWFMSETLECPFCQGPIPMDLVGVKRQLDGRHKGGITDRQREAPAMLDSYLTETEAAVRIGLSKETLFRERKHRGRVPYHRIGGRVYYTEDDIKQYLESTRRSP